MLRNFKYFIVFYGFLSILLMIDQWLFGIISHIGLIRPFGIRPPDLFLQMSIGQRLLGLLVSSMGITFFIGTLYALYGIIDNLQNNKTFTQDTMDKMNRMTKFYLASILFYPVYSTAYSFITSMHLPNGQRFISVRFGTDNLDQILIASCLYIVFRIMKEAYQISSEYKMVV